MLAYVVRRLGSSLVTLWLVASLIFILFFVLPGGAGRKGPSGLTPIAQLFAGRAQGLEIRLEIQERLGLDETVPVQYARYMGRLVRGDLGTSYGFLGRAPVWPLIRSSLWPTFELMLGASVLFLAGGYAVAYYSRRASTRRLKFGWLLGSSFLMSMPQFVLATLLFLVVARFSSGEFTLVGLYVPRSEGLTQWAEAMWAPWLILALPFVGFYARLIGTSMAEVQREEFIRTAEAKGMNELGVEKHIARASLIPVLTQFGLNLGLLVSGCIVVEEIFDIPGLGRLIFDSSFVGDFPILSGVTLIASIIVILANFAVDVLYTYVDPRIRLEKAY